MNVKSQFNYIVKTLGYVYKCDLKHALLRDVSFVIETLLDMFQILFGGKFIDATAKLLVESSISSINEYLKTESFYYLAIMLATWIVLKAMANFRSTISITIETNLEHKVRYDVLNKISHENLEEVEQKRFQDLMTFVPNYSISRLYQAYEAFSEMLRYFVSVVSSFVIMSRTVQNSALFLIMIAIPEPLIQFIDERRLQRYRLNEVDRLDFTDYIDMLISDVKYFAELRVNGVFKYLLKAFDVTNREYLNGMIKHFKKNYSDNVIFSMFGQVMKYGYIVFLLIKSIAEGVSIGQFKALYDYANTLYGSSYSFIREFLILLDHVSYTQEYFDLIEYEGFGDLDSGLRKLKAGTPKIEFQHLDFEYPDEPGVKVLENVNLVIEPGQKVAFVGGDGSGKSSLVKTFCGLYEIVAGDYVLDGYSIRELSRGELKNKISVVFQNFIRYNFSIKDNITITSEKERLNKDLYKKVKKICGVSDFIKSERLDDNQILGKYFGTGKEISPGYWQRLAIARMLYRDREINIMDEPFTYIDGPSREVILKNVIDFLGSDKTLIYISQNTDHLKYFDVVYYISGGKVVESGTLRELMRKKGKFYKEAMANR